MADPGNVWATGVWAAGVWEQGVWADSTVSVPDPGGFGTFFAWARGIAYERQLVKPQRLWPPEDYVEPGDTKHTT